MFRFAESDSLAIIRLAGSESWRSATSRHSSVSRKESKTVVCFAKGNILPIIAAADPGDWELALKERIGPVA